MAKKRTLFDSILVTKFAIVNSLLPWHRLRKVVGAINLLAYRIVLREKNLHNTRAENLVGEGKGIIPEMPGTLDALKARFNPEYLVRRFSEGQYNDLRDPLMGAALTRFGRNVPLTDAQQAASDPNIAQPSARLVSEALLARREFIPATTLNLLAAAWIQFMTHDWFHHHVPAVPATGFTPADLIPVDLPPGDPWNGNDGAPSGRMWIRRTPADPTRIPAGNDGPPTFLNDGSHWWDGSQIYGNDENETRDLRCDPMIVEWHYIQDQVIHAISDKAFLKLPPSEQAALKAERFARDARGELKLVGDRMALPINPKTDQPKVGVFDNWWIGLALMHTIFSQEHNAIAARLRLEYPHWNSDRIFHTARLVNVALMAKIHTVEWTPAILKHPAIEVALNVNWSGFATAKITDVFGRLSTAEEVSGIPGSPLDQNKVPYSLTEEFVSVYRLHPLLPDAIQFQRVDTGEKLPLQLMEDLLGDKVIPYLKSTGLEMDDVCYSFGIANPGAPVLHNYPNFLRKLQRPDDNGVNPNRVIDLATIDITRDRERGVPRYNKFRELLHRGRVSTFEQITGEPADNHPKADELRAVYQSVDRVDLMAGMYAEKFPEGFGFSDTAFRVFILMASRRLKSDRFFTTDFTDDVYSKVGMQWIKDNNMSSVILRHFPGLGSSLRSLDNAFAPWPKVW